jgi:hypothetical protein
MGEQQIFNALIEFFEEDEWDFQWVQGLPVLSLGFDGKHGKWQCVAQAREAQQQFVFYSIMPISVPEDKRAKMAEFLTRVNYGMVIGNFEMDYDDGEIRYKTSIDVEGVEISPALIRQVVYGNVIITDRYYNGIMRIIYGTQSPLEVLEEVEDAALDELSEDEIELEDLDDEEIAGMVDMLLDKFGDYVVYDDYDVDDLDDEDDEDDDDYPSPPFQNGSPYSLN